MMMRIGKVLSGATTNYVEVRLERTDINVEDLVIIEDTERQRKLLGVIRGITLYNPAYARHQAREITTDIQLAREYFEYANAFVEILGEIKSAFKPYNTYPPPPATPVYKLTEKYNLQIQPKQPINVGYHKYTKLPIPLDAEQVVCHIGVFGATGTGKTTTCRRLAYELYNAGYSVIIFDHTGVDYTPYFPQENIVKGDEIILDAEVIAEIICRLANLYNDIEKFEVVCGWYQEAVNEGKKKWSEFTEKFTEYFTTKKTGATKKLYVYDYTLEKYKFRMKKVEKAFLEKLDNRKYKPEDIVRKALENGLLIVDLSTEWLEARQSIIAWVLRKTWEMIEKNRRPIDEISQRRGLIFLIDEAQNYCPARGNPPSKYWIIKTAREGRKWKLSIIIASQRYTADIDPQIRENLGTLFFSRLQTKQDIEEIKKNIDLGYTSTSSLFCLDRGDFFIAGLMNPLRKPLLIHINPFPVKP